MLYYLLLLYSFVPFAKFCFMGMARAYWDYQTSARLHTHTPSPLIASLSPVYRHPTGGSHSAVLQYDTGQDKCDMPLLPPSGLFLHLHRGILLPCSALVGLAGLAGLVLVSCVKFDGEHHKSGLLHLQGALNIESSESAITSPSGSTRGAARKDSRETSCLSCKVSV